MVLTLGFRHSYRASATMRAHTISHTHMAEDIISQMRICRLTEVLWTVRKLQDIHSSRPPYVLGSTTHEKRTKGLRGPCKMEDVRRCKIHHYLQTLAYSAPNSILVLAVTHLEENVDRHVRQTPEAASQLASAPSTFRSPNILCRSLCAALSCSRHGGRRQEVDTRPFWIDVPRQMR